MTAIVFTVARVLFSFKLEEVRIKWSVWILALVLALILRGVYPAPEFRKWGEDPVEKAVLYLRDHGQEGSFLASFSPGYAIAANMKWLRISHQQEELKSGKEFVEWMKSKGAKAILVDPMLREKGAYVYSLIESEFGNALRVIVGRPDGGVQLVVLNEGF